LNILLIIVLKEKLFLGYSSSRFITAAIIFVGSYTAHRKITFDFVKKIGIGIYVIKNEDISKIYSKIKYYSDFIHIDLVDNTFFKKAKEVDLSLMKKIDKTWGLQKMIHIMSEKPSFWIKKLNKSVDVIIFHFEIKESINEIIKLCKDYNKKVGLVLNLGSEVKDITRYLPYLDFVQVMGIDHLGQSGQSLNVRSLNKVNELNKLKKKYKFEIIFDGGVKPTNISKINAKYVVSASGLLSSNDPIKSFMELKTSSKYSFSEKLLKKDLILKIKDITNSLEFIKSGNIVGSFSEGKGLDGVCDIDIVLISDRLNKQKFGLIIKKFNILKKEIESKYGYNVILNNTLGPLKFDPQSIVFHLMLYDVKSHRLHCEKSPFTCFDWQRSKIFFKKPMKEEGRVFTLQPNHFFDFRRGVKEYLSEIKSNKLSYREYKFIGNSVIEEKKYQIMNSRDRIEFSYHILKFLMSNLLKLYSGKNKIYKFNEMIKKYFGVFPKNKFRHKRLIKNIKNLKERCKFKEPENLIKNLELFIKDFKLQFRNYFYKNSTDLFFIRHAKTRLNIKNKFIGQKLNPKIMKPDEKQIAKLETSMKEIDLVFSSPAERCKNTLELVTNKIPQITDLLKEINYGSAEGKDLNYLLTNHPEIVRAWKNGEDPKFPEGENQLEVIKRIKKFLKSIGEYENKKILVCTHNVVLRSIIGSCLKMPVEDWFKINIPYLDPIKFITTKDKRIYIDLTSNQIKEIFKNL